MLTIPSRPEFRELSRSGRCAGARGGASFSAGRSVPVATFLPWEGTAEDLFQAVDFPPPRILLESARTHPVTGRYSLIVGEPTAALTAKGNRITLEGPEGTRRWEGSPLEELQRILEGRRAAPVAGLPPFVGGAVGLFGFDAYRYFGELQTNAHDDLSLPDLQFLFFDQAILLDHALKRLWVIVLADPALEADRAYDGAVGRIDALIRRLIRSPVSPERTVHPSTKAFFRSTHTRAGFEAMVRRAKGFIADGEIYQANLSQRFTAPLTQEPWDLYRRLTAINPSPFAAFADLGRFQVVSASPERFLQVRGRRVETRPIAGTRPRGGSAVETARLRQELILNEKERAEHLMLVDLERNDLGRVCRYGSVRVDEWMVLEEYSHVIHIVSNVRGTLRPKARPVDLVAAAFPGGTITGCPKIRCLKVIDELEPVRRQL
ncbi:MAG: anthranilate synthase component I family protein, partial [Candidatus Omnitrophica bacterium]|nr:anthranilate synthase component I family protein [Candidatus Omnitrophota bacterium]